MSVIATAVKHMLAANMSHDEIVAAIAEMEDSFSPGVVHTKRQERNKRYYERLKSSEKRLNKTEQDVSDGGALSPEKSSPTPPKKQTPIDPPSPPKGGSSPTGSGVSEALDAYHAVADRCGLASVRVLTPVRQRKLAAMVRQHGMAVWLEALGKVEASDFCTGQNDRGWRADLDFLLQPSSFTALLEGRYDNRDGLKRKEPPPKPRNIGDAIRDEARRLGVLKDEPVSENRGFHDEGHSTGNVRVLDLAFRPSLKGFG
ncbi:DNA replication protein [Brucella anthropi]|uniref:DNA replication protein n=1 Tax=Brucella anthropi TaxID=529 RepID=UPI003D9884C8